MAGPDKQPMLGMAMRFNVTIEGLDLGDWSACKGLEMTATIHKAFDPGQYAFERLLFADATYPIVKLERAIDASSEKVRKWVQSKLAPWQQPAAIPFGSFFLGDTATITLLDAGWQEVTSWELRNVYPAAWRGPSLSARKAEVATETLELAHEGFL
jgi:phage tail-like protein